MSAISLFFNAKPYTTPKQVDEHTKHYNDAYSDFKVILTVESELEEDNKRVELYLHKLILKTMVFFKTYFDGEGRYNNHSDFEMELPFSSIDQLNAHVLIFKILYGFAVPQTLPMDVCLEYYSGTSYLGMNNVPLLNWKLPKIQFDSDVKGEFPVYDSHGYHMFYLDETFEDGHTFKLSFLISTGENKTNETINFKYNSSDKYNINVKKPLNVLGFIMNATLSIKPYQSDEPSYDSDGNFKFIIVKDKIEFILTLNQGAGKDNKFTFVVTKYVDTGDFVDISKELEGYCNFLIQERDDDDNPLFETEEAMNNNDKSSKMYRVKLPRY